MQTNYYGSIEYAHIEYDDFGEYMEDNRLIVVEEGQPDGQFLRKYGKIA